MLDSQQSNFSITYTFKAVSVLLLLYFVFITLVSQIPRLQIIPINRKASQYIPDTFVVVIRNDSGSMVFFDPWHTSNHYKLITTPCREFCSQLRGQQAAIVDHCSNHTVDKAQASYYLTWKVQLRAALCLFGGSIKWFLAAPKGEYGR